MLQATTKKLISAVRDDDLEAVENLLGAGFKLDCKDEVSPSTAFSLLRVSSCTLAIHLICCNAMRLRLLFLCTLPTGILKLLDGVLVVAIVMMK